MTVTSHSLFSQTFKPSTEQVDSAAKAISRQDVEVRMASDLDCEVAERRDSGWTVVGTSEFVGKGNFGVSREAGVQAERIAASLVLVGMWPAKLRAVKRLPDGSVDLASVLADPPAYLSPRGHYLVKAVYFRRR